MRTTININDAILRELRERARQRGRPFREVVEETLKSGMAVDSRPRRRTVRIQTHGVGVKAAYRGMSMNQLYDQLEAEDTAKAAEK